MHFTHAKIKINSMFFLKNLQFAYFQLCLWNIYLIVFRYSKTKSKFMSSINKSKSFSVTFVYPKYGEIRNKYH